MTPIPIPCPHCGSVLKVRDPNMIGRRAKCPKCAQAFRLEEPAAVGATTAGVAANQTEQPVAAPAPATAADLGFANWPTDGAPAGVAVQLQAQRKKNRRRTLVGACVSAVVLLIGGLVALYAYKSMPKELPIEEEDEFAAWTEPSDSQTESSKAKVEPIEFKYIPAGTRIAIHVRPAELWAPDSKGEEFQFCLGPLSELLTAKIKEFAKREPAEVTEALFCLIPNERGTPPDIAAVFHLKEEAKKSQLLDDFGGRRTEASDGTPFYIAGERAYLFPDLQTIAVCPAKLAEEMVSAVNDIQPASQGIDELIFLTDRSRPVTVMFEPTSTKLDAEFLMPPTAIPLLEQFCEWLGPEVETGVWSLEWKKKQVRSELLVRNQGGLDARSLEKKLQHNLDDLAVNVLHTVEQMSPKEAGRRKIIGRFPAMTRVFTLATRTEPGTRYVRMVTQLPERAAPNLALGALLAWDESTRTVLKSKSSSSGDGDKEKPDNTPIAEKLKRKISVEFKREPLAQAFGYIAGEIKAKLDVDGDGLKLSAYTKNMPQSFALENVPAIDVIKKILKQPMYEKMCLVVDEKQNSLLITTYPVAEQKGLKPYVFPE